MNAVNFDKISYVGLAVMVMGAIFALGREKIAPRRSGYVGIIGLVLACVGAVMTLKLI